MKAFCYSEWLENDLISNVMLYNILKSQKSVLYNTYKQVVVSELC